MIEAMYGIEFASNQNDGGFGIVILETGRILGGDSSFVFVGDYEVVNGSVQARIKCTNDRKILQSVFGNINEFNLVLDGASGHNEMTLSGHMVENPAMAIAVKLTRRAELP